MPSHAVFVRAINLGRNRRVTGAQLVELFEDMGFDEVASFQTSGNVVLAAGRESEAKLRARVEKALTTAFGFDAEVFVRSAAQVRAIVDHEPFKPALVEKSKGKLQVSFLSKKPAAGARKKVEALASDQDLLAFEERELYWLPSAGTLESELDRDAIAAALGPATMRTKGTVERLAAKFFGPD